MNAVLEAREPSARYLAALEPPLLGQFDLIAQAPNGISRLRELILSLAVQGKLVPQNVNDEPACVLLENIRVEKARLLKEGKIRADKPLAAIDDEETPFGLPLAWEWERLGHVVDVIRGITFPANEKTKEPAEGRIGCLRTTNVQDLIEWDDLLFIDRSFMGREEQVVQLSDIVMSMANSRELVGKVAIVKEIPVPEATIGGFLSVLRPRSVLPQFLMIMLRTQYARSSLIDSASQTTNIANISLGKLNPLLIPVPPTDEQSRIVARVEELMTLCDTLEAKGKLEAKQHARLVGSLFDSLANSESAHALAENWQRIATHFDLLLDRPAAVDALEQTILQLAVRGLLVPQDPADEPASALLQKIRAEKDRLIATGQLKRDKPLPPTSNEETPVELPEGWGFVSFPELCVIGGGATPSKAKPTYWEGDLPWVSPKDMKVDFISDAQDHVSKLALEETRLPLVPKSSLLIVVRGMILAHSFPVGVTQVEVTINQDMKSLTPLYPALTPYLALVCKGFKQEILELVERSSHGTCKLESDKLFAFRFGLPPLAEQSRIVARVAELRALCAQLRERLATTAQIQSRLAETLIEKAVA